ncbi:hypothetical protein CJF32_00001976 [Rutstroemia sp. NJR-2017a WRK4]|nr:hypothetical protein CJF32_00001976 [Rutstroemia sp. NJR-2017a WRK4]
MSQAYGSTAFAWWAAHSSNAVELAKECPDGWFNAMLVLPGGQTWFNLIVIFAACRTEVLVATTTSPAFNSGPRARKQEQRLFRDPIVSATVTPQSGGAGRGEDLEMWVMAGTGFVAAAANSL